MYIGFALAALLLTLTVLRAGELVRARRFPRILIPIVGMKPERSGSEYRVRILRVRRNEYLPDD